MKKLSVCVALCAFSLLLLRPVSIQADELWLAQMESEGRHTFRGGGSESRDTPHPVQSPPRESAAGTLPLRPLRISCGQDSLTPDHSRMLRAALGTSPLLQLNSPDTGADIRLIAQPPEKHSSSPQLRIRLENASDAVSGGRQDFLLPKDAAVLRTVLEGHMRLRTLTASKGSMPWPDVLCSVQAHSPADSAGPGTIRHEKKNWRPTHSFTLSQDRLEPIRHPALLTFSFNNRSKAAYWIYVLNYNDAGQILPVLPPLGAANMPNRVAAGKELAAAQLFLELTAPVEYVQVILSQNPLDIQALAQESFASGRLTPGAGRGKPVNTHAWSSVTVKLTASP